MDGKPVNLEVKCGRKESGGDGGGGGGASGGQERKGWEADSEQTRQSEGEARKKRQKESCSNCQLSTVN